MSNSISDAIKIYSVTAAQDVAEALARITIDCIQEDSAVGFMAPLTIERALSFW